MPAEELGLKFFTRERIRTRMLKRAAEVWGYSDSEIDEFDPLVSLLVEACSLEFERTASEIGKTQNRMLERLAQLMYPEVTTVYPSYGILQAVPIESECLLNTTSQFIIKASIAGKVNDPSSLLYFSPAKETRLVKGAVSFIVTSREIHSVEEGVQKIQLAASTRTDLTHQHSIWLGINLDGDITSLAGLTFFFNWVHATDAASMYNYLPLTGWSMQSLPLEIQQGFPDDGIEKSASDELQDQFNTMKRIEDEIAGMYARQFVTITEAPSFNKMNLQKELYPKEFRQWYDSKDLEELKEPLIWVEIKFPTTIATEILDTVLITINSFPVINRKLNKLPYRLQQSLNIVPLEAEGSFLAIREICNSNGSLINLAPFGNPYELQPESYTLRYAVNRFNERSSYETLINLLDLLREESSYFSSLGEDFLMQHVRELNQILARMESKVKLQNKHASPYPFLTINKGKAGSNVSIDFWSCAGSGGNKVPVGSKLNPYQLNSIQQNSIFMMTNSTGGKDSMSDAEKLVQYKKALYTRNRVVTPEDVRVVVLAELGNAVKAVQIQKNFMKATASASGFVRCVEIILTPAEKVIDQEEWIQKIDRLQMILVKQSANNLPYNIHLKV